MGTQKHEPRRQELNPKGCFLGGRHASLHPSLFPHRQTCLSLSAHFLKTFWHSHYHTQGHLCVWLPGIAPIYLSAWHATSPSSSPEANLMSLLLHCFPIFPFPWGGVEKHPPFSPRRGWKGALLLAWHAGRSGRREGEW